MSARRKARKRALDELYSADVKGVILEEAFPDIVKQAEADQPRLSTWPYARQILEGVIEHGVQLDAVLSATSTSWPLERMPLVDKAILRMGAWELLFNPDVEPAVVISEAVDLANDMSTESSGAFVHGILAAIAREHRMS